MERSLTGIIQDVIEDQIQIRNLKNEITKLHQILDIIFTYWPVKSQGTYVFNSEEEMKAYNRIQQLLK